MLSRPPNTPARPPGHPLHNQNSSASTATYSAPVATHDPLYPPQLAPGVTPEASSDAPPSYEDAMADGVGVVDGGRREYSGVTDVNAPGLDEGGKGRR